MTALTALPSVDTLNLAGEWRFELDRANTGANDRWFDRKLAATATLPGSLPGQHIGDPITVETKWTGGIFDRSWFTSPDFARYRDPKNLKVPFWLQPETHYVGAAWFQREITIPDSWSGRSLSLVLERPHWKTTAWVDGDRVGSNDALSVPHRYSIGPLTPGTHRLTIRVDNTFDPDIGENSHSVSDHTQGNWNGIVGQITLSPVPTLAVDGLQVFPDVRKRSVIIRGRVMASSGATLPPAVNVSGGPVGAPMREAIDAPVAADGSFSVDYALGPDAPLWDEFSPTLHRIIVRAGESKQELRFGLREISTDGRQLRLNGRKLFLRGALECAAFPRTGHPPVDVESWRKLIRTVQAHGLNHLRFHSWCPPEAAFIAADELGLYLQIEVASWPNQSTSLGDGKPVDAWLEAETDRILQTYGNHPSFVLLCACNEPGGKAADPWLAAWITRHKARDPRRLYTAGAGWPEVAPNDVHIRSEPRIQQWGQGLQSRINALPPETRSDYREFIRARSVPVISHEIGQWCVYPNFAEMPKYTGYLKPRNFEIFQESLVAHQLGGQAHDFLIASGKLQALCYKEDIESALRTTEMGGFQLLGLADFPGQGTALVGVLDAFWEEKGYITPQAFRRFCGPTVPLARLERRVFTTGERLTAEVEIAHFGASPIVNARPRWALVRDNGEVAASGDFTPGDIPVGAGHRLGTIDRALNDLAAPARYKLVVSLPGEHIENDWDIWVYPATVDAADPKSAVLVTSQLDHAALDRLAAGGAVVLTVPSERVRPDPRKGKIALGFSSIFWNTAWTNGQAPHTLGILCDPSHPALARFPTAAYSNWQWWYVVTHAAPMILDELPPELRPVIQVVDDWFTNRKLALAFEARVGAGRLLVTSVDFASGNPDPVRRQLQTSLLDYAASKRFAPNVTLNPEQIRRLFAD